MKKKIMAMLLAVCLVVSCFVLTGGYSTDTDDHEHEMQKSCLYQWCYCGYVIPGPSAHAWVFVHDNSPTQHYKLCINCWAEKDYENHGWYTSGGKTYCGSCGFPKP